MSVLLNSVLTLDVRKGSGSGIVYCNLLSLLRIHLERDLPIHLEERAEGTPRLFSVRAKLDADHPLEVVRSHTNLPPHSPQRCFYWEGEGVELEAFLWCERANHDSLTASGSSSGSLSKIPV